jgi:CPA2 family monovalent cation:H+ antiporter-2
VEKEDGNLLSPEADMLLEAGDVVWVVGEKEDVYHLLDKK